MSFCDEFWACLVSPLIDFNLAFLDIELDSRREHA